MGILKIFSTLPLAGETAGPEDKSTKAVVHVAETVKGGVDTYLKNLYDVSQWEQFFVVPSDSVLAENENGIVTFNRTNIRLINIFVIYFKLFLILPRIFLSRRQVNIHLHSSYAGLLRLGLFFLPRTNVVYCSHGWSFDMTDSALKRQLLERIELSLSLLCDRVVCISNYDRQQALEVGLNNKNLFLAKNSIPTETIRPRAPKLCQKKKLSLLFAGRLDRQKGVVDLLEAFSMVDRLDIELQLAGDFVVCNRDDYYKNEVMERVGGDPRVTWHGWVSNSRLEGFYKSSDILIVPSRWEGFGLVALEAYSHALPVIGRSVGGLKELLDSSVSYSYEDNKDLVSIISSLDPIDINEKSRNCQNFLKKNYNFDELLRNLDSVYV